MDNLDRFKNIAVLGAAGKMGSGILLINVLHSAQLMHNPDYMGQHFVIHAIDTSFERLGGLTDYLKAQVLKWAEKNVVWLRKAYNNRPHLIDNKDIIDTFVYEALGLVKPAIHIEAAYDAHLVFEAIIEDEATKVAVFKKIKDNSRVEPWFLSNTSSIPITALSDGAKLNGNIIGCHFYNPPAVQKLIEVISMRNGNPTLTALVEGFAKRTGKLVVPSNDVAGFIGNGFFMRDILLAESKVNELTVELGTTKAIAAMDVLTRDALVRPMGIFQLVDYVGLDVCVFIMEVMSKHLKASLKSDLLLRLLAKGIKGGQHPDGSQKDGIFRYEKGMPSGIYNIENGEYDDLTSMQNEIKAFWGIQAEGYSWKQLSRSKLAGQHLEDFFTKLMAEQSRGAKMAQSYMKAAKTIGQELVSDGVTNRPEHVNEVMMNGFYHLYGPINKYI